MTEIRVMNKKIIWLKQFLIYGSNKYSLDCQHKWHTLAL